MPSTGPSPTTSPIPSWQPIRIDLSPFLSSSSALNADAKQATVLALRHACQTDGLFLLDCKGWIHEGRKPYPDADDIKKGDQSTSSDTPSSSSLQDSKSSYLSTKPPVLDAISSFFALPLEQKQALPSIHSKGFSRGYIPLMGESGLKAQYCEWKEGFSLGYEEEEKDEGKEEGKEESIALPFCSVEPRKVTKQQQYPQQPQRRFSNPLEGPNVWPSSPTALDALRLGGGRGGGKGWKEELVTFFRDLVVLSGALTRALSLALDQEEGWLGGVCGKGGERISLLRAFHYFPSSSLPPSIPLSRAMGSSPHTDWGLLTIILEEEARDNGGEGGLQIRRRRGRRPQGEEGGREGGEEEEFEWVGVRAVPGTLIVNCGDFLSLLSERVPVRTEGEREGGEGNKEEEEEEGGREGREGRKPFFQSPVHRVTLSQEQHRTSLVFFYYPSFDAPMEEGGRERGAAGKAYNTLMQVEEEGGKQGGRQGERRTATFGEHITRKWAEVKLS